MEADEREPIPIGLLNDTDGSKVGSRDLRGAQWSADGSALVALGANDSLHTIDMHCHSSNRSLAQSLTSNISKPSSPFNQLSLRSSHTIPSANSIRAFAIYPFWSSHQTAYILTSTPDHPIRLSPAYPSTSPSFTYKLISPTTEAFTAPYSLTFSPLGTHFLAGSSSSLSLFDVSRDGDPPLRTIPTIPSRRHPLKGGSVGIRGLVAALDASTAHSLVAAGTLTRGVGLYDFRAPPASAAVAVFRLPGCRGARRHHGNGGDECEEYPGGAGVSYLRWSPVGDGGRYLYVAERRSGGALVYDVRGLGRQVCWLRGRRAETNQRLGFEVRAVAAGTYGGDGREEVGQEVLVGGVDGVIRVWEDPWKTEGPVDASSSWKAHEDPVVDVTTWPWGGVVATCSGRDYNADEESTDEDGDSPVASHLMSVPVYGDKRELAWQDSGLKLWYTGKMAFDDIEQNEANEQDVALSG